MATGAWAQFALCALVPGLRVICVGVSMMQSFVCGLVFDLAKLAWRCGYSQAA